MTYAESVSYRRGGEKGSPPVPTIIEGFQRVGLDREWAYRDAIRVLLANPLGLSLAFLERMLVLELGAHG